MRISQIILISCLGLSAIGQTFVLSGFARYDSAPTITGARTPCAATNAANQLQAYFWGEYGITLGWTMADTNAIGTLVYLGTSSRNYDHRTFAGGTNLFVGLAPGTYYFSSTMLYSNGDESGMSSETVATINKSTLRIQ